MKLVNYLLELDDKKYVKKGSDNIRVYGIGNIIKKIFADLKKYKTTEEIEKRIRTHQTFSNWIIGKSGIAIQELYDLCLYWKDTCRLTDEEFIEIWEEIYNKIEYFGSTNGKQIRLSKILDGKLAYLLGVIFGDGHLTDPNKSYDKLTSYNSELRITDGHKETFIMLGKIFEELFEYTPSIYSEKSKTGKLFYRFVIKSKPLHRFLMIVCEMPYGNKSGKLRVPRIIEEAPIELQKWFIGGFFDADGYIGLTNNRWPVVHITQYDSTILKEIKEISQEMNIHWNGPYEYRYKYNNCTIKIQNKKNVEMFLNWIPSLNPIKIKQREKIWKKLKEKNYM